MFRYHRTICLENGFNVLGVRKTWTQIQETYESNTQMQLLNTVSYVPKNISSVQRFKSPFQNGCHVFAFFE